MTVKNLARLFDRAPLAAGLRHFTQNSQAIAALPVQFETAEQLKGWWSLGNWLKGWQESSWLAMPKKKVSPHRRGMRNAGKHQKMVPVMSRCKACSKVFPIHQLARCKAEKCPGRYPQAA